MAAIITPVTKVNKRKPQKHVNSLHSFKGAIQWTVKVSIIGCVRGILLVGL